MRSLKYWCCIMNPLELGLPHLLLLTWGLIWQWWVENHLVPNLHPVMGRRNPIYPLTTPTLVGEPYNTYKQTLGILQIMNCTSSWRISTGRLYSERWTHNPETPHTIGKSCRKWGSWCGRPGGHLSERQRVGSPRATISASCPCVTRWRMGAQRITPHPPVPVQPDEDVGYIINTLAMGLWIGTPHQHLQWWCYARQNEGVIWVVVPQGMVCKRPLPRVSGQRKHSTFSQGGSRHGQIHGSYH